MEEDKNWKCTNMHSERDETVLNKELLRRKCIQIIQRENKKKKLWRQEIMILEKYIRKIAIYAPMIFRAWCVMFWMRPAPLQRQVGGVWALEIKRFLGPVKWHRADRRVPFGAQKTRDFQGPTPSHLPK